MASAFETSLRKWNSKTASHREESAKKPPPRRSRSVSDFSRTKPDVSSEFSTTRDNPLFWTADAPLETSSNIERGRSVSRNRHAGNGRPIRGRSVSRGPISRASESEVNEERKPSARYTNTSALSTASTGGKKANSPWSDVTSARGQRLRSSQLKRESSAAFARSLSRSRNQLMEDGESPSSLFEPHGLSFSASGPFQAFQGDDFTTGDFAAEGIYKAIRSEVRHAISDIHSDLETVFQRSGATAVGNVDVTDIPADLVSPGAVELVLGVRSEYTKKLEQSQERATKLRADLAIEEHRALELSRILNEVLPDTKANSARKSRPGRKSNTERKKISRNLTEEALAYFDECVSLSTFDGSDFSQDDPPLANQPNDLVNGRQWNLEAPVDGCPNLHSCALGCIKTNGDGDMTEDQPSVGLNCNPKTGGSPRSEFSFSFSSKADRGCKVQDDISYYMRSFEKASCKMELKSSSGEGLNGCDVEEYGSKLVAESLLFDHLVLKNRIETGCLHLCPAGMAISFSPFASII